MLSTLSSAKAVPSTVSVVKFLHFSPLPSPHYFRSYNLGFLEFDAHMLPLIVSSLVPADGLVSCLREGLVHLFPFPSSNDLSQSGLGISSQYIPFDSLSPWACWRSSILFTGGVALEFVLRHGLSQVGHSGMEHGFMTCIFESLWRWVMVSWSGRGRRREGGNMGFRWILAHISSRNNDHLKARIIH